MPIAERPDLVFSMENCNPIHGVPGNRCFDCDPVRGLNCNGIKGALSLEHARRIVAEKAVERVKTGRPPRNGKTGSPPRAANTEDKGRPW